MADHPIIIDLINGEIDARMNKFSSYETVKKFKLLNRPFTIEKGELTPKMSIVRKVVEKNYLTLIN